MKENGWSYCSGIVPCRQRLKFGLFIQDREKRSKEPHWHKIYESEEGKAFIDFDVMYEQPGSCRITGEVSYLEHEEKDYCVDKHLCIECKRQIGREEDFYMLRYPRGYCWCTECNTSRYEYFKGRDGYDGKGLIKRAGSEWHPPGEVKQ